MITHSKRIKKTDDINDKDEGPFGTDYGCTIYIISIFFAFTYSIIFCVPYFFTIYFFQLFLMLKIKRQKDEDKANNFLIIIIFGNFIIISIYENNYVMVKFNSYYYIKYFY